jgi:hypothetical protein
MNILLNVTLKSSTLSRNHFVNKNQNEVERFVFAGIEKTRKISSTILRLYSEMNDNNEVEFSLGILVRSLLMDIILVLKIKKLYADYEGIISDEFKSDLKTCCYKIISDGTSHFIEEIFASENLSTEDKKEFSSKFVSIFPEAFDTSSEKPKLYKDFRTSLKGIYESSKHPKLVNRETIYNLYSYYSKYDHLSNWTPLSFHFPFEERKGKLDLSIILIAMHLKDLLLIASEFDNEYKVLMPHIIELENSLKDGEHFKIID